MRRLVALLTLVLLAPAAPAAGAANGSIVFSSIRDATTTHLPPAELYVMNADGSGQTRLTHTPEREEHPDVSPDGSRITFAADGELYVMDADGTDRLQLTDDPWWHSAPAFSADGARILWAQGSELHAIDADGSDRQVLATNLGEAPAVDPAGAGVAYHCGDDICLAGLDGSGVRALTVTPGVTERDPAFSPDGSQVAFSRSGALVVARADGSGERTITPARSDAEARQPAFSPDGTKVVFTGTHVPALGPAYGLHVVDVASGALARLTCGDDGEADWGPAIAPGAAGGSGTPCLPDADRDGIPDRDDACPQVAGGGAFGGCGPPGPTPGDLLAPAPPPTLAMLRAVLEDGAAQLGRELRVTTRGRLLERGTLRLRNGRTPVDGSLTVEVRAPRGPVLLRGTRAVGPAALGGGTARMTRAGRRRLVRPGPARLVVALRFVPARASGQPPVTHRLAVRIPRVLR